MGRLFFLIAGILLLTATEFGAADKQSNSIRGKLPPAAPGPIDFQRDIKPIFAKSCISCHGPSKHKGGLRLDDGTEAMKGGNSGPVIKPGDATQSRLLLLVAGLDPDLRMPPPEGKKPLTTEEVGKLRAWIEQGAKWPKQTGGLTERPKSSHWAFAPPKRPPIPSFNGGPQGRADGWCRNEIDYFIRARLTAEKTAPSPEADRATLIRRLSLDLRGLPPSLEEVDRFLADTKPDAYDRLVDRLLDSPHYGERWGRHWLDMARYADSDGFEKDNGRPYAWRWRDWVINAFNRDVPFDQFTIEQLAGDLLPNTTTEQKTATGFHRNTLTNTEGGVDKEQFRVEAVVDRVSTTATVWLGLTMGCARCHDHKYDPFSQREFYQLFAFFNSDVETDIPAPLPGEEEVFKPKKAASDKKHAELLAAVAAYKKDHLPAAQQKWESELRLPALQKQPANITAVLVIDPTKRTDKQKQELAGYYAKTDKKLAELNKAVTDHQNAAPRITLAQTLALGPHRKTHVMIRGDFLRSGAQVEPGAPGVLSPTRPTKNRLDLASWIVDPANPLTARVTVNWIWQRYFGRGIVNTLEDFGVQGEKPSHPELLDWLATELIRQKWSLKAIHKLIVKSATYRQSSAARPELVGRDPLNILLARQNRLRLEAEIVRDNALAASGLLTRRIGGPSVHPPQPSGISELTYAGSARWNESTGPDRYRRGMYTWFQRTSPYPMLMTFDEPDSNTCTVRRERSNTPLQALTLLNDTVFVECAQALGKRVIADLPARSASKDITHERIRHAFRLCLAREPNETELKTLARLFDELLQEAKSKPDAAAKLVGKQSAGVDLPEAAAWVALARTIMNLDEFVTRE